jgi:L-ascorbate metabolism protein UlaG (beta-lactamase superfamily)
VTRVRLTHIGGPTTLLEVADWRILTDPTFDEPGRTYRFGLATSSRKTTGPAVPAAELGPIDVVLLGLRAWETTRLEAPGRPAIDVLATPCRHGPPLSRPLVGDVIGFALAWDAQEHGVLWISGDTVRYGGVRSVAERRTVSLAVLHLGEDPFPVTGPVRYTMTAADGVELCRTIRPRSVVPVHYEGWSHFRQGRTAIEQALADAPDVRDSFQILPIGLGTHLTV